MAATAPKSVILFKSQFDVDLHSLHESVRIVNDGQDNLETKEEDEDHEKLEDQVE